MTNATAEIITADKFRPGFAFLDSFGTFPCLFRRDNPGGWNNFACPYFDRAAIDNLIAATNAVAKDCPDGTETMSWDGDVLVLTSPAYPGEESVTKLHPADINGRLYWTPGAFEWCWAEAEPDRRYKKHFPHMARVDLPVFEGFTDTSWKNDMMPSFTRHIGCDRKLVIWADHPEPAEREFPDGTQYTLSYESGDDHTYIETITDTDDPAALQLCIDGFLAQQFTIRPEFRQLPESAEEADAMIGRIHAAGLDWHFDDDPETIVIHGTGFKPAFTVAEAAWIKQYLLPAFHENLEDPHHNAWRYAVKAGDIVPDEDDESLAGLDDIKPAY